MTTDMVEIFCQVVSIVWLAGISILLLRTMQDLASCQAAIAMLIVRLRMDKDDNDGDEDE